MNQTASDLRQNQNYITQPAITRERDSDYALARAAANGMAASVGDLYERHNRQVYSLCLRMTHNVAEAEDLILLETRSRNCTRLGGSSGGC
jgi:hypothetical protein